MSDTPIPPFADFGLAPAVLQAVTEVGYENPSPIQAEAIPPLLLGRDLLGQAQTGTGKTAAFALPLLSRLDLAVRAPQMLVLTPTRELAIQVAEALQTYARHMKGFHVLPIYGGQAIGLQLRQLERGAHVIVGTPGRVIDHLKRRTLRLDRLTSVVLDEADEMLRMGFIDDVEEILEATPDKRQVALFSATMPPAIARVANKHLNDPVEIRIASKTATVATVEQRFWPVSGLHKLDALTRILEVEAFDGMLIFVRTKQATEELATRLEARGYAATALNGDMPQPLRERTVERLRSGALDIVVATDVAARGLDVERITHVINYDIPYDPEAYVHRIGRTGRAGRTGQAILFVAPRERRMLRIIEQATRQQITPMRLPTREDVTDRRVARFKTLLDETLEVQELDFFRKVVEGYREERGTDIEVVAAALAFLVQRERPLEPVAESQPAGRGARPERASRPERIERSERAPRERDAPQRDRPERRPPRDDNRGQAEPGWVRYRIEVGRDHGVQPKNIVGAIANEAELDSRNIGEIKLYDGYSTVELPEGMPKEIFRHLQAVWICGRQLLISIDGRPETMAARKKVKTMPGKGKKPRLAIGKGKGAKSERKTVRKSAPMGKAKHRPK
ncbi:MAG: DEAD/DEAH box helicase [Gammaproteobacteria bacterium]|jgi:ATP-dependent RNA helicase DeaD|nr:DEAD/DEAH box helicase [Gammaproteobacteria bacterium]